ncbi:hypothetical protein [Azotobacter vinelandii]|uniref:hypothetical protein n=1 Tax=Azotobacter vinelandii TaxID=354 RepID=UPI00266665EC|nr:hypothetical protein [Azotobacter vinelandii]WKN21800.1 hypothetical protein AVAEIV_004916 [Azotobacter vinelandii]
MSNHQDTSGIGASSTSGWQRKKTWILLFLATVVLLSLGFLAQAFVHALYKGELEPLFEDKWKFLAYPLAFDASWAVVILYLYKRWRASGDRYSYWMALPLGLLGYSMLSLIFSSLDLIVSTPALIESGRTSPGYYVYALFQSMLLLSLLALQNLVNFFISIPLAFKLFWSHDKTRAR